MINSNNPRLYNIFTDPFIASSDVAVIVAELRRYRVQHNLKKIISLKVSQINFDLT